jgi:hypothetical protein
MTSGISKSKEGTMRLSVKGFLAAASLAAIALFTGCAADSPTDQHINAGGGGNSGGLSLQLSTTNPNPVAGQCTLIEAFATFNGVAVSNGTPIVFSTNLGVFAQNNSNNVSLVTQDGAATAVLCSASSGTATVRATVSFQNKTATRTIAIQFSSNGIPTCPFISQCAVPSSGPVTGGTTITITGCGFGTAINQVRVFFKHGTTIVPGTVTAVTDTSITAITPAFPGLDASAATPVDLEVVLGAGFTLTSPNCFTYTGTGVQPAVNAILPSSGTKLGGTRVTIFGSGFTAPVQVTFGGGTGGGSALQAEVVSVTFNQIIAITPPATANGTITFPETVPVVVKNVTCQPSGTVTCQSDGTVTYTYTNPLQIFGLSPDHGDLSTTITIFGTGFVPPVIVTFGGSDAQVVSVTGTEILVRPPAGASGCGVGGSPTVTNLSTGESATCAGDACTFTVLAPTALSITPNSGPGGTATQATIVGTDLFPSGSPGAVQIGSVSGGTVSMVGTPTDVNGLQTVTVNVTPNVCSAAVTFILTNTATHCSTATITFTNSTLSTTPPIVAFTTTAAASPPHTLNFTSTVTGGTAPYTYSWTFAGQSVTPPTPTTSTAASPTVTWDCGTSGPACTIAATAALTVTDTCGLTASIPATAVSPP